MVEYLKKQQFNYCSEKNFIIIIKFILKKTNKNTYKDYINDFYIYFSTTKHHKNILDFVLYEKEIVLDSKEHHLLFRIFKLYLPEEVYSEGISFFIKEYEFCNKIK